MKDFTEKVTSKVKEQIEQVGESVSQVVTAGRGLYFKLSETSTKQFEELVKVGEAKQEAGETIVTHLKESLQEIDPKSSATQLRYAALGLLNKTVENSEKVFSDLVEYGEGNTTKPKEKAPVKKKPASKAA